jgi:hypothetical protein
MSDYRCYRVCARVRYQDVCLGEHGGFEELVRRFLSPFTRSGAVWMGVSPETGCTAAEEGFLAVDFRSPEWTLAEVLENLFLGQRRESVTVLEILVCLVSYSPSYEESLREAETWIAQQGGCLEKRWRGTLGSRRSACTRQWERGCE